MEELRALREIVADKSQQTMRAVEAYSRIMSLVNAQENEPSLWFKDAVLLRNTPAQTALRALHAAVVNEREAFCDVGYPKLDPKTPPSAPEALPGETP